MPRKPRFYLPDIPVHVVQRGHSRDPVFFEDEDYQAYLDWLHESAERYRCKLHAYVLMTNHVHILTTPIDKQGVSSMMQYLGRKYVPYINYLYGTSGTLWEGRYKASLIQAERYLLTCMRYIELNPIRANLVKLPWLYRWSSCRYNAQGKFDNRVTPHNIYLALGKTNQERQAAYKKLFDGHVNEKEFDQIRESWQSGTPLGNNFFKEKIEQKLKTKVGQSRRGRPKRAIDATNNS